MDTIFTVVQEGRGSSPQPPSLGTGTLPLDHQPAARPAGPIIKMSPFSPNGGDSLVSLHFMSDQLDRFFFFFLRGCLVVPSYKSLLSLHTCIQTRVAFDMYSIAVKNRPPPMRGCLDTTENKTILHTQLNVGCLDLSYLIVGRRVCRGLSIAPRGVLQPCCPCLCVKCTSSNRTPKDGLELSH